MELVTAVQATAIITDVVSYITSNWAALAVLLGFGLGFGIFRRLANGMIHGRI